MKKKTFICIVPEVLSRSFDQYANQQKWNYHIVKFNYIKTAYYLSKLLKWKWLIKFSLQLGFNKALKRSFNIDKTKNEGVLLVIAGIKLNRKNVNVLKTSNLFKILWYTDSSLRGGGIKKQEGLFDEVWYHDGGDFENSNHISKKWIPYGFNSSIYYCGENQVKDIDVLFTGYLKLPQYQTRLEYLELLMNSDLMHKYKIVAAVTTQDPSLIKRIENSGITYTGRLAEDDYASYIKRAKVVVNILQDDGVKPINPLFFAIPYAGGIQIINKRSYLNDWLQSGVHFYETEPPNLITLIYDILNNQISLDIKSAKSETQKFSFQHLLKLYFF